jgi:ATP-dependent protease ClpP protease subunit
MAKDIYIYGEIGWQVTLLDVQTAIAAANEDDELIVHIQSFGGDYYEGLGMYHALMDSGKKVTTINEGYVASAATLPMLAGSERIALEGTRFMVHLPFTWSEGNSKDLEKMAESLKAIDEDVAAMYSKRTGTDAETWTALMTDETEINSAKGLEMGVYTEVRELKMSKRQKSAINMNLIDKMKEKLQMKQAPKMLTLEQGEEGLTIVEGEVAVGESVTVGEEQAPAGEHQIGEEIIVVDDNGIITEVRPVEAEMNADERIEALEGQITEMSSNITEMKEALMMMAEAVGSSHEPKQRKSPEMTKFKGKEEKKTLAQRKAERNSK